MQITPRVLKGFRDFLPEVETRRKELLRTLENHFPRFGFAPIDTPVLEYADVLLGKGGGETDKQVYRFTDHGDRDVAMRFDLTVPFARFMALHRPELYLPFKRYHIAKVFRGENTQRGRYREFIQCDFDIVGTSAESADIEVVLLIISAMEALGVPSVTVHISHRGVFNRLLAAYNVEKESGEILRRVDKSRKIGRERTEASLAGITSDEIAARILTFIDASGSAEETIIAMEELAGGAAEDTQRLRSIIETMNHVGMADRIVVDPSITRGLDYYTGVVFETFLTGAESIGSVCSGGRYDDLVSLYSKEAMPGVGASIGLDRLLAGLEELGGAIATPSVADVLVTMQDPALTPHYHAIAQGLRAREIRCEVFPDIKKLGQQFAFAEKKGIPVALVCGRSEYEAGTVNARILSERRNIDGLDLDTFVDEVRLANS